MNLIHNGHECEVIFARYYNGNNAIQLIGAKGSQYEGEVISVASVNGEDVVPEDVVGIKTWSENEGIVESLVEGGVIEDELLYNEPTGFVAIEYYKLTKESLKEINRLKEE